MLVGVGIVGSAIVWPFRQARRHEQDRQRLFHAIRYSDSITVRTLLESGMDANERSQAETSPGPTALIKIALHLQSRPANKSGTSALAQALIYNVAPEIVRLLLAHGARVNTVEDGWTPLTLALEPPSGQPRPAVVQLLLERGADPNVRPPASGGDGPLDYALSNDGTDLGPLTKSLLDHGADPTQPQRDGRSYLTAEIQAQHLKTVAVMLDHVAHIDGRDTYDGGTPGGAGQTPLAAAISAGNLDMVRMILARGAHIQPADQEGLIRNAVYKRDENFLKTLLARGVRIDSKDRGGMTALMNAAYGSNGDRDRQERMVSMKMLLAHGASLGARNSAGQTPLMVTCWYPQDLPQLKFFMTHGADPNAHDREGTTALDYAAIEGAGGETVSYLLAHGAQVSHSDRGGSNALMYAALNGGDPKGVALLVAAGCDPLARDRKGNTALMLAHLHHHTEVLQALRKAGATR
jgi:ankyrin repeat protein